MKAFLQKYGVYLLALVLFIGLALIYCKPVLSGKVLQSGDNTNAVCNQQNGHYGEYSWWNGSLFSGMPSYQIGGGVYKSNQVLSVVYHVIYRDMNNPVWVLFYYFLCFFILLRCFGVKPSLSIAGAIAIALSSYFLVIIAAGHYTKTTTLTFIPLVMGGFYLIYRKRYWLGAIFVTLFTCLGLTDHPQMAYYIFLMMGLCFLAELVIHAREKRWKDFVLATVIFLASLGIGIGTTSSSIFANAEYTRETMRGGHSDLVREGDAAEDANTNGLDIAYATQWSYGIDESFSFLIPGFKGGSSVYPLGPSSNTYKTARAMGIPAKAAQDFVRAIPMYWGDQPFTAGNVYMGAIVCFLFLLGCLIVPGPYKWALILSTLFSVMLAWGSNCMWLTEFFFKYFPFYNKFRAVSSILIVAEFAMPLLGFLALKALTDGTVTREKAKKSILTASGITAGLCLFFALFGKSIYSFIGPGDDAFAGQLPVKIYDAIVADRAALLTGDAWRSFLFIVAAAVLIFLYNEKKLKLVPLAAGLGVLILADMWPVDKRYFNDSNFVSPKARQAVFDKQPWEEILLQDPDPHFRIMNLTTNTFNESRSNYWLKSVGGYHAAKLRRYQDLIDEHLSQGNMPVIGMLNAKYLIVPDENNQPTPQLNPYALGNAWFVGDILVVDNANQESDALNTIDLENTAVVDRQFAGFVKDPHPGIAPDASVELTYFRPKKVEYDSHSSADGTIVFSEIYYPYGWKASIDGQPVDHFRANYTLRALNVPAGDHHITFIFDPDSVRKGDTIALTCIIAMYLLILAAIATGCIRLSRIKSLS
ncbi:MAG: YfhO family protein [Bacteroidales bacterium]|nr:YfhO family protein [Bacteroidales bacterium]